MAGIAAMVAGPGRPRWAFCPGHPHWIGLYHYDRLPYAADFRGRPSAAATRPFEKQPTSFTPMTTSDAATAADPALEGYWSDSRQPLASLIFVTPLLLTYEAGTDPFGAPCRPQWARGLAAVAAGMGVFGQYFLLPVLIVCILLAWHHTTRHRWRLSPGLFYGMAVEWAFRFLPASGVVFAGTLIASTRRRPNPGRQPHIASLVRTAVGYLGAGIYEGLLPPDPPFLNFRAVSGVRPGAGPGINAGRGRQQPDFLRRTLRRARRRQAAVVQLPLSFRSRRLLRHLVHLPRFRHRRVALMRVTTCWSDCIQRGTDTIGGSCAGAP